MCFAKNVSKKLSGKYSQKLLNHAKQSATDVLKITLKRVTDKTAKATDDLIGNKIAFMKITKVSKTSQHNNSVAVNNEHDKEKGRHRSPEERQKIVVDLRLI